MYYSNCSRHGPVFRCLPSVVLTSTLTVDSIHLQHCWLQGQTAYNQQQMDANVQLGFDYTSDVTKYLGNSVRTWVVPMHTPHIFYPCALNNTAGFAACETSNTLAAY
jgi:hypothetical protein